MGYIPTMPYARFIPAVVLALLFPLNSQAQAPSPAPPQAPAPPAAPEQPTQGEVRIDEAIIKVRLIKQVAASIDQTVDMLNQKFKLEGNYYKDFSVDNVLKIRLQLKLDGLGDTGSTMLQVCDGKTLWDYQKVLKMQLFKKKDITPIMEKLNASSLDPFYRSLVISNLGFGGPESMLTGLRRAVKFDTCLPVKLDGVDVWDVGGTWVDRSKLIDMNGRPLPPTVELPPYVPSTVHVFIGQENGWPYKIVMTGNKPSMTLEDSRAIDPVSGRPVGVKKAPPKVDPTQITLLYKLLPVSEINSGLFNFTPPADVSPGAVTDETEMFLGQLNMLIESENNRKRAEAAKTGEEPAIKGTLEVGRPQDLGARDTFPAAPANPPTTPTPTPPK